LLVNSSTGRLISAQPTARTAQPTARTMNIATRQPAPATFTVSRQNTPTISVPRLTTPTTISVPRHQGPATLTAVPPRLTAPGAVTMSAARLSPPTLERMPLVTGLTQPAQRTVVRTNKEYISSLENALFNPRSPVSATQPTIRHAIPAVRPATQPVPILEKMRMQLSAATGAQSLQTSRTITPGTQYMTTSGQPIRFVTSKGGTPQMQVVQGKAGLVAARPATSMSAPKPQATVQHLIRTPSGQLIRAPANLIQASKSGGAAQIMVSRPQVQGASRPQLVQIAGTPRPMYAQIVTGPDGKQTITQLIPARPGQIIRQAAVAPRAGTVVQRAGQQILLSNPSMAGRVVQQPTMQTLVSPSTGRPLSIRSVLPSALTQPRNPQQQLSAPRLKPMNIPSKTNLAHVIPAVQTVSVSNPAAANIASTSTSNMTMPTIKQLVAGPDGRQQLVVVNAPDRNSPASIARPGQRLLILQSPTPADAKNTPSPSNGERAASPEVIDVG